MTQNIDQKICDVLREISERTKSIAKNLEKLNSTKGEKYGKNERSVYNHTRAKVV